MIHIAFIGRLEREKWADIVQDIIQHSSERDSLIWHIYGDGSLRSWFDALAWENVRIYGHVDSGTISEALKTEINITLMPSRFLETFWLVGAESVANWVWVIGLRKWGLKDWINSHGTLDEDNIIGSFDDIIRSVKTSGTSLLLEWVTKSMTRSDWEESIRQKTEWKDRILIVHNYQAKIWWAEIYVHMLRNTLRSLGKTVILDGYVGTPNPAKRRLLALIAPLSFWQWWAMKQSIKSAKPDLIWIHGIERYRWIWWLQAIVESGMPTYITHHDLGLIVARPSAITEEKDIPEKLSLATTIRGASSLLEICLRIGKYISLRLLWIYLQKIDLHIVPSEFMRASVRGFGAKQVEVFPHTVD